MRAALDADMSTFDTTDAYADITAEVSRGKPSRASAASALSLEVCPRAGHEDRPLGAPGDQGVVEKLSAVVTI